ncbi:MAG: extracellular solute-binding protein [Chloroflexi bacterium]|nr:extracellular solute-binding protein [Chloroflexota bacterium]
MRFDRRSLLIGAFGAASMTVLAACAGTPASPTAAPKAAEPTKPAAPAATTAPAAAPATAPAAAPTSAPAAATKPAATPAPAAKVTVSNPPTSADMVDAVDLAGKNIEVVYWHNRPQKDQEMLQTMLDEFNKANPFGIKARPEIAGASYPDVYNKVNAAIQAGQPPEISVAYQNQAAFYRGRGAVIDLNPFLASKKYGLTADDQKDYFPTFLASDANPQFKGERLGFPTQRSIEVMFTNVDWLKQLGYNEIPKDWKTWEEAATKAADPSKNKYGFAVRHDASNFASQIFARGGRVLAEDGSAYTFNGPAGVETVTTLQRMLKNKSAVEIPTAERFGEQNRFGNGELLFVLASSSGLPFYKEVVDKGGKFAWDISLPPYTEKPAVNLYGASVSVYKTTPEKEVAAWMVIKFLGEKAQTAKWAINTGYLPVRQSAKADVVAAYKSNPAWGSVADSYAKMFDWFQYAMVESPVAGYDPVRSLIDKDILTRIMTDPAADPKKILDEAVAKSNQILKDEAPKP